MDNLGKLERYQEKHSEIVNIASLSKKQVMKYKNKNKNKKKHDLTIGESRVLKYLLKHRLRFTCKNHNPLHYNYKGKVEEYSFYIPKLKLLIDVQGASLYQKYQGTSHYQDRERFATSKGYHYLMIPFKNIQSGFRYKQDLKTCLLNIRKL